MILGAQKSKEEEAEPRARNEGEGGQSARETEEERNGIEGEGGRAPRGETKVEGAENCSTMVKLLMLLEMGLEEAGRRVDEGARRGECWKERGGGKEGAG